MRDNNTNSTFDNKLLKNCMISAAISLIVFAILSSFFSFIILKNTNLSDKTYIISLVVLSVSSIICGFLSAKSNIKTKGIISGCVSGLIFCVFVYILLSIFSMFKFSYKAVLILPIVLLFSILGAIIKKNI